MWSRAGAALPDLTPGSPGAGRVWARPVVTLHSKSGRPSCSAAQRTTSVTPSSSWETTEIRGLPAWISSRSCACMDGPGAEGYDQLFGRRVRGLYHEHGPPRATHPETAW